MKKPVAFLAAAMMATVPLALSVNEASALCKNNIGCQAGIGAGIGAFVGTALANQAAQARQPNVVVVQPAPQPVYVAPVQGFSQAHYAFCQGKYRSYHAPSNTYQPNNLAIPRQPCYSPYM